MRIPLRFKIQDAYFKLNSKISNSINKRNLSTRSSSAPFLCSDTYFSYCDVHILNEQELETFISSRNKTHKRMYILGSLVDKLLENIDEANFIQLDFLIIMESDNLQDVSKLKKLLSITQKIYSNNLVGQHEKIDPLPLGLERQAYRSSGRLNNFKKPPILEINSRPITFLIAWNDSTNINRVKVKEIFGKDSRSLLVNKRINARTIHKLMRKALFVPSPAGNGLDCHRTWEALYLGCVPVVIRSEYCGNESWPIMVIDDWTELTSKNENELNQIYNKFKLDRDKALEFSKMILNNISELK